jgi:hypothetical protein
MNNKNVRSKNKKENKMPQFDIASFFPQITFFATLFLLFYVFLTKNTLPKIGQNLKLNKKMNDFLNIFSLKGLKDINLLSHIYKPQNIILHRIYKETLCLITLQKYTETILVTFLASLNWLEKTHEKNTKIRLIKLNRVYFSILNDTYYKAHDNKTRQINN